MGTVTAEPLLALDLEDRQAGYRRWCNTVRDPATASTEGLRQISADSGSAVAQYEVAQLPNGTWAVRVRCEYRCGNYSAMGTPWTEFPLRDHCISYFLNVARRHFRHTIDSRKSSKQRLAQLSMSERLADGLFGFTEPTPLSG